MSSKPPGYSLKALLLYFLKLGTIGFGGPIALVGYMQKDLVEKRQWITKEEYMRGLAFSQLSPGPLAAQLAICIGYFKNKRIGATLAGIVFILPSFIMVVLLGMLYLSYGKLPWVQSLFYGIGAAVIGIIVRSAYKLSKLILQKKIFLWILSAAMCCITIYTRRENVLLFILSGIVAIFVYTPPKTKSPKIASIIPLFSAPVGNAGVLTGIFLFFLKASFFVFGSGLAIVPFLHGGVVEQHHWLNERQFLDAVAVAMITPGPVVITVGFIGYLVARLPGAIAASVGVFLPVYLFVVILLPYFERYGKNPQVAAFVQGVSAAAVGAIAGAVFLLGQNAIIDIPTALIAGGTLLILFRFKIPEAVLVVTSGLLGLILHH